MFGLQRQQHWIERQSDAAGTDQADLPMRGVVIGEPAVQTPLSLIEFSAVVEQGAPGRRDLGVSRSADQQRPEAPLELLDVLADGGLRQIEAVCRSREAAKLGQGGEGAQPLRIYH
nr:hypothetical protein [Solimonas marina]